MPIGFDAQNAIQAFFFLNFFLETSRNCPEGLGTSKKCPAGLGNVKKLSHRVRNVKKLPHRVSGENRGLGLFQCKFSF